VSSLRSKCCYCFLILQGLYDSGMGLLSDECSERERIEGVGKWMWFRIFPTEDLLFWELLLHRNTLMEGIDRVAT
jgi:hypothetical protein